jgi:hypothetical protein
MQKVPATGGSNGEEEQERSGLYEWSGAGASWNIYSGAATLIMPLP